MNRPASALARGWLWTYTAGMPPQEADDRRSEIQSDLWEFSRYANRKGLRSADGLRRLIAGVPDDIAWRVGFGRHGLSRARGHEAILLLALVVFLCVALPAGAWWAVALAGDPGQPQLQILYIGSESIALACTVIGGAASAAYYPRLGRALMLAGSATLTATLWWTPLAWIVGLSAVVAVLALPSRAPS